MVDQLTVHRFISGFCYIDLCLVFMPAPYCCDCCSFAMHFEIRMYDAFSFALLFSRLLWQFRVFCGSIQIWGLFFSVSVEKMPLVF